MLHALLTGGSYRHGACKYMPLQDLCEDYMAYLKSNGHGTLRYKDWLNEYQDTFEELGLGVMSDKREYPPNSGQKLNTRWVLGVSKDHLFAFVTDDSMYAIDVHLHMPLKELRDSYTKYRNSNGHGTFRYTFRYKDWLNEYQDTFEELALIVESDEREYPPNSGQKLNTRWVLGIAPRRG